MKTPVMNGNSLLISTSATQLSPALQQVQGCGEPRTLELKCHQALQLLALRYCKTHYYRGPFNFTHFALGDDNAYTSTNTGADMRSK